jgi:hypothetical protein
VTSKPTLQPVEPVEGGADAPSSPGQRLGPAREGPSWLTVALAVALAVTIVLLIWSRVRLTERIEGLEAQIVELREDVAVRDLVIDAQGDRLGEVRRRVDSLKDVLEQPLPTVD